MANTYNQYNLEASFKEFLVAENIQPISLRNYMSDVRHFLGWLTIHELQAKESSPTILEVLTPSAIEGYKAYLLANVPHKTVNRRLSTMRRFCAFCTSQGWIAENPAVGIKNSKFRIQNASLDEYELHLKNSGLADNEIIENITNVRELLLIS